MNVIQHRTTRTAFLVWAWLVACTGAYGQTAQALHLRALAATCANCHGTDGRAVAGEATTRLAGLPRDYIVAQLQAFRDGGKTATVMHQISKGYSNEQIDALAAYFAGK